MSVATVTDHRIPKDVADLLAQPAAYADGRIYEAYAWLRRNEPLGVAEIEGVDPFWVVTRHADILEVSRQNDLFHNGDRAVTSPPRPWTRRSAR
jgi:cytochrome P450